MEIEAKIIEIILRISQKEISPDPYQALFESVLLDSFAPPDVVTEIERQCSVQISDSDLNPQKFDSVSLIRDYLEDR